MTPWSGRGLWAHVATCVFFATAVSTAACQHREVVSRSAAVSTRAAVSTGGAGAQAVVSEGTGRWQGCEVLGPGNDTSPPAMVITCDDGRRFSRVEVPRGHFTEETYRDNVDRFIEAALGFHVRPESTTLTLREGHEARVARLVTRVSQKGSVFQTGEGQTQDAPSADTAILLVGVFLPSDTGSFITCSRPLEGPRTEHDFDDCDEDVRELFANPPWPGTIPDRG